MNLLRGVVAVALALLLFGCAPKHTNQPNQPSVSTEQNSSAQTQTAAPAPAPEQPKYLVPILLGKNKQEVLDILGNPDQTYKIQGVTSTWIYLSKPAPDFHLNVSFERWSMPYKAQKPQATVQQVTCEYASVHDMSPRMVLPEEILNQKPEAFFGRESAGAVIDIIWHLKGQSFVVTVSAAKWGESLFADETKMNLKTENLEISHRLTSQGNNWPDQHLFRFYQLNGYYRNDQINYIPSVNPATGLYNDKPVVLKP